MKTLIERLETINDRIESRNEYFKKLIRQTKVLAASKPKMIINNGTLKIQ